MKAGRRTEKVSSREKSGHTWRLRRSDLDKDRITERPEAKGQKNG
jgi:hypothetical protein